MVLSRGHLSLLQQCSNLVDSEQTLRPRKISAILLDCFYTARLQLHCDDGSLHCCHAAPPSILSIPVVSKTGHESTLENKELVSGIHIAK